ncbi:MAG: transglycosylase domain-containing protein [Clostridia bacterium]|nr:transglycosylase domain-containing protein [Clostridia bacterium]
MNKFKDTALAVLASIRDVFHSPSMRVVGKCLGFVAKTLLTVFLIGMITACIFGCVLTIYVLDTFSNSSNIPDLSRIMNGGTSIIYTQNDKGEWVESQRLEGENSIWADLETIPDYMQKAVIAIEDERFYQHKGVDWKRTGAAVLNEVLSGGSSFGGSTITQQLIKVVTEDNDVTIERKIREIFTALELERDYYTKEDIMEAYLNVLPLSDSVIGVGAAANYYFNKDVSELSLAECALIAGITNRPAYYDPYDHPDHAKNRQELILNKMYELGFITEDEYRQAYGEELHYQRSQTYVKVNDYYTDLLIKDVIADLQETYGYGYTYAENLVFRGGLRIYSYEDVETQQAVEAIFRDDSNFPDVSGAENQPTAAIFIMDYEGRVVATVGDRGEKVGNRVQNIATDSRRQPGSSIKPLSVYAPAVDLNLINYSTVVANQPIKLGDGSKWPHNFGETTEAATGWRTVQKAVQQSHNTIPAQILKKMGIDTSYNFLTQNLHFTSLEESDKNYSPLALGGFTYGVTVREMAAGYQIFGNGGFYNSPHTYHKVEVGSEVLLQHMPEHEQAISPESATIMNKLLQKVVTQGTAYAIYGDLDMQVFAKTGTTDDNVDSYFAGGTPHYVGAIWMGYKDNQHLTDYQRAQAKEIWSKCMQKVHQLSDKTTGEFPIWGEVEGHYYDSETGVVSAYGDAHGYYKAGYVPYTSNSFESVDPVTPLETTTTTESTEPSEGEGEGGETGETESPEGGEGGEGEGGETTDPPEGGGEDIPSEVADDPQSRQSPV